MSGNYAIFVSSHWGYVPFVNALFNSLAKRKWRHRVYFIYHEDVLPAYIDALKALPFEVVPLKINPTDHDLADDPGRNLFMKQTRFRYIREHGTAHDAICMLDADMFCVSERFENLFNLVAGTSHLIGCEERIKWGFDKRYTADGKPLFDRPVKAYKFMCSVPIIFDLKKWTDVFDTYNRLAFKAWEVDEQGNRKKRVGDIYTWSVSIYLNNRQDDCVLLPMHSMTQVHGTAGASWCALKNENGYWYCADGCEVYTVHGRIGTADWADSQRRWYANALAAGGQKYEGKIRDTAEAAYRFIQREWWECNFGNDAVINLYKFFPQNAIWDACREGK